MDWEISDLLHAERVKEPSSDIVCGDDGSIFYLDNFSFEDAKEKLSGHIFVFDCIKEHAKGEQGISFYCPQKERIIVLDEERFNKLIECYDTKNEDEENIIDSWRAKEILYLMKDFDEDIVSCAIAYIAYAIVADTIIDFNMIDDDHRSVFNSLFEYFENIKKRKRND